MTRRALLFSLLFAAACGTATAPVDPSTLRRVEGLVLRGPITPVCQVDVPCDAPFASSFALFRDIQLIGSFSTGDNGRFTLFLEPGSYVVVPRGESPIRTPGLQQLRMQVADTGTTTVTLRFDTGIR